MHKTFAKQTDVKKATSWVKKNKSRKISPLTITNCFCKVNFFLSSEFTEMENEVVNSNE